MTTSESMTSCFDRTESGFFSTLNLWMLNLLDTSPLNIGMVFIDSVLNALPSMRIVGAGRAGPLAESCFQCFVTFSVAYAKGT